MKVMIFGLNFGPYHLARLQHLANHCDLTAIELVRGQPDHPWLISEPSQVDFDWKYLYKNLDYQKIKRQDYITKMNNLLMSLQPDVLLIPGYSPYFSYYLLKWAKKHQKTPILMIDSTAGDKKRNVIKEWFKGYLVRQFQAAIISGTLCKKYLVGLGMPATRIFFGYDVVDNHFFKTSATIIRNNETLKREQYHLPKEYFLLVCRLIEQKNIFSLIDAYCLYQATTPLPWPLIICGDGPLKNDITAYIAEKKVKSVELRPFQQINQLVIYYALATVFILPSISETWGLVLNEAMACNLPILCSNKVGAHADLVQDGQNGFIFNPTNTQEIAEKMITFANLSNTERHALGHKSGEIIKNWDLARFTQAVLAATKLTQPAGIRS